VQAYPKRQPEGAERTWELERENLLALRRWGGIGLAVRRLRAGEHGTANWERSVKLVAFKG